MSSGSTESELVEENKKLRQEVRKLRTENMQLKEDGCKQRILMSGNSSSKSSGGDERLSGSTPSDLMAQQRLQKQDLMSLGANPQEIFALLSNPNVMAIGIVLLVVGIVIGKLLF